MNVNWGCPESQWGRLSVGMLQGVGGIYLQFTFETQSRTVSVDDYTKDGGPKAI